VEHDRKGKVVLGHAVGVPHSSREEMRDAWASRGWVDSSKGRLKGGFSPSEMF
jgi:hypothetical protein